MFHLYPSLYFNIISRKFIVLLFILSYLDFRNSQTNYLFYLSFSKSKSDLIILFFLFPYLNLFLGILIEKPGLRLIFSITSIYRTKLIVIYIILYLFEKQPSL